MDLLFSIIVPTYNSAKIITSCLESILFQTYQDFEILIIDGLSQDNTIGEINAFEDVRIRVYSEKDAGIYDAMNKGIKIAKGEWLLFLGSDDKLHDDNVLKNVLNHALETDKKVVYGNTLVLGNTSWANDQTVYDGKFNFKKILEKNICHQSIFYHREVFDRLGKFDTTYSVCADYDFNLKAFSIYQFCYVDIIISKFVAGGASTSTSDEKFVREKDINILKYFGLKLIGMRENRIFYHKLVLMKNRSYKSIGIVNKCKVLIYFFLLWSLKVIKLIPT